MEWYDIETNVHQKVEVSITPIKQKVTDFERLLNYYELLLNKQNDAMQQVFLAVFGTKNIDIANLVQSMKFEKGYIAEEGKSDAANSGLSSHRSIT